MPGDSTLSAIVAGVKEHHAPLSGDTTATVPLELRGKLADAVASVPAPLEPLSADTHTPFAYANVRAVNATEWKGLRTRMETILDMTKDVRSARTLSAAITHAHTLPQRFMATGVYNDVRVAHAPTIGGQGTDLVLELDERTYSVNTGVAQTLSGKVEAYTEASLMNHFGFAETFTATVGSSGNELSISGLQDIFSGVPALSRGGKATQQPANAFARVHEMLSPTITLAFHRPTFLGNITPISLRYRSETERYHMTSGFTDRVQELEATITDSSNKHSLSYALAWRNVVPIKHPGNLFAFSASPEIVSNATSSLKSSVAYSYVRNRLSSRSLPSKGTSTMLRAELAGLGGDVNFFKLAINWIGAASLWRYAPDTGYEAPLSKSAWVQRQAAYARSLSSSGKLTMEEAEHLRAAAASTALGLRQHPSLLFSPLTPTAAAGHESHGHGSVLAQFGTDTTTGGGSADATSPQTRVHVPVGEYTWKHRLLGWLSPGITANVDATAGVVLPISSQGITSEPVQIVDRFFVTGARFRGFDAVGPTATPVPGGVPTGDALGGDVMATVTSRLLLPPPLPSVRLANAGMRTQLFATAGVLCDRRGIKTADDLLNRRSVAAGVGLTMPLGQAASLEANYTLWSEKQPSDVVASFRLQLSM